MVGHMGILDRILRAGEGKKLKALQGIVPDINALATIIILVVAIGVLIAAWIMFRQQKQRELELRMSEEAE